MKYLSLFWVMVFLGQNWAFAQTHQIGLPPIINYSKQDYQAETQNWAIKQDPRGIMYFGNNQGLLEFDGSSWQCLPLPNKSIVRSLAPSASGDIYVGGQDELGYFKPNLQGSYQFHSLKKYLPKDHLLFEDVWEVFSSKEGIYWCTQQQIFLWKDGSMSVILPQKKFEGFFSTQNNIYVHEPGIGIQLLGANGLELLNKGETFADMRISAMVENEQGQLYIFTVLDGIYLYENEKLNKWGQGIDDYVKENQIYKAIALQNGLWAIGTSHNGLLILDEEGYPVRTINKATGLPTNSILSMFEDRWGNLWLGLENGISQIEIQSPFSFIDSRLGIEGAAYSSIIHKQKLYLATNQGIYSQNWADPPGPLSPGHFQKVDASIGPTWSLNLLDESLIAGQHLGAYTIQGAKATPLSDIQGAWKFMQLDKHPTHAIEGTYAGLAIYEKQGNVWRFKKTLEGFDESARVMEQDKEGNIWISHPYRGVYKIQLNHDLSQIEKLSFYNSEHGFPSNLSINVGRIQDQLFFTTEKGVYVYDKKQDSFHPYPSFNKLFEDSLAIQRLIEDEMSNIWFSTATEFGMLTIEEDIIKKEVGKLNFNQLAKRLVKGYEHIYAYDQNHIFIGIDQGFVLFNPTDEDPVTAELPMYIRSVTTMQDRDSLVFAGTFLDNDSLHFGQPKSRIPTFPKQTNDLRFTFSSAYYEFFDELEYQHRLDGEQDNWSEWSRKTEKEFTNLSPGNYTFQVRARNIYGNLSSVASYSFVILTPWYQTLWARLGLVTALASFLFIAFNVNTQRAKKSVKILMQEQTANIEKKAVAFRQEVEKSEAEIFRLKNEKLEAEMAHKNKELASYAMHMVQKSELLLTLKQQLEKLKKEAVPEKQQQFKQLLKTIEDDIQLDKDWEKFEYHFDEVHEQFSQAIERALSQPHRQGQKALRLSADEPIHQGDRPPHGYIRPWGGDWPLPPAEKD